MSASKAHHTPLLIFPCNGNGREAADALGCAFDLIGFVDDAPGKQGTTVSGVPVMGREAFDQYRDALVLAVPGSSSSYTMRRRVIAELGLSLERFATVIHPAASVSSYASIGRNVLLMAGVVITSNARIGDHVCILPNTVIHHDTVVGIFTLLGANVTVAGNTTIGDNCYIGSGSSIMNGLRIGQKSLVGLGSNVLHAVPDGAKMAGNPARQIGTVSQR